LAINLCKFDCENEYVCPATFSFIIFDDDGVAS
jgi:hypothetical protein